MEIRKVLKRIDGVKYCIIPKNSDINGGDFVAIDKINEKEVIKNARRKGRKGK